MSQNTISLSPGKGEAKLTIQVDDFTGVAHMYFLTHAHSDHMGGLKGKNKWKRGDHGGAKIYCTEFTKRILMQSECSVDEGSIEVLQEGRNAVRVEVADRVLFVTVTVIPDEHCAGSCLLLINFGEDTILHTGDYKYNKEMVETIRKSHNSCDNHKHNFRIFIDPTFWHNSWSHPVLRTHNYLEQTIQIIHRGLEKNSKRKVCLLMSPLGNEKIICDLAAVRLGSNDEPAPILLDTTQKMDRKYKDAWENMLDYCDGAVTSDREDWERRGGIIYACPCFQRGRTKKEKRIATSIKEVKIKLGRVVERTHDEKEKQKLEGHLKELSAERERLKEIRGTYWTGWNLRSRAHLEIQEGKKREEDTDIFIRLSTLAFATVQSKGKAKKFVFDHCKELVAKSPHPGPRTGSTTEQNEASRLPWVYRCLYSMHSLRFEHDELIKRLGKPQVLSGLSGVSAYPFGKILQDANCKKRREEECKRWKTADESLARKLSGEGGLQDGGLGQEDDFIQGEEGDDKVCSDDSDFTDEDMMDDGQVQEVKDEMEEQGEIDVKVETSTPPASDLTTSLDVTADTVVCGSPPPVDRNDVATPEDMDADDRYDSVIPETPSPKRLGKRSRRR